VSHSLNKCDHKWYKILQMLIMNPLTPQYVQITIEWSLNVHNYSFFYFLAFWLLWKLWICSWPDIHSYFISSPLCQRTPSQNIKAKMWRKTKFNSNAQIFLDDNFDTAIKGNVEAVHSDKGLQHEGHDLPPALLLCSLLTRLSGLDSIERFWFVTIRLNIR